MQYITTEEVEEKLFLIIESKSLIKNIRDIISLSSPEDLKEYKKSFVKYNFQSINIE